MNSLLPLLIIVAGASANMEKLKSMVGYSKNVAIQAELHEITKMMKLDQISGAELPKPGAFGVYLKANMHVQKAKNSVARDVTLDQYGTAYKLEYTEDNHIRVTSAGADLNFGTSDDIYSERALN